MELKSYNCREFTTALASNAPVPGGGGASALSGALGAALGHMVGSLTVGKKKYAEVEEDIKCLMEKSRQLQEDLLQLVEEDAKVFSVLAKAYGMPKETEEERQEKDRVMEVALRDACSVPMEIMRKCGEAITLSAEFAEKGSLLAISDAGCSAAMLKGALESAALNVFINTKAMKDRDYADQINGEANALISTYGKLAAEVYALVMGKF